MTVPPVGFVAGAAFAADVVFASLAGAAAGLAAGSFSFCAKLTAAAQCRTSTTTITKYRGEPSAKAEDELEVADVYWQITTDRTSFTADVTFHYTAAEIALIDESTLQVYTSANASGPYTPLTTVLDASQNAATVTGLTSFSYFALKGAKSIPASTLPTTLALVAALAAVGVMAAARRRQS